MGLDAVVYKRLEEVQFEPNLKLDALRIHQPTGEIYFENDQCDLRREDIIAIERHLGNVAMVDFLRVTVANLLEGHQGTSVLLSKVLYDGTHCEDVIPIEDLSALKHEILFLKEGAVHQNLVELQRFLSAMEELVNAAEHNGNPVVFT